MGILPSALYLALHCTSATGRGTLHGSSHLLCGGVLHIHDVDIVVDLQTRLCGDDRRSDLVMVEFVDEARVEREGFRRSGLCRGCGRCSSLVVVSRSAEDTSGLVVTHRCGEDTWTESQETD